MEQWWFVVGLAITSLSLAAVHWMPCAKPLALLWRYAVGVGGILAGFTIWRLPAGDWVTPLGLLCFAVVAGATVFGCYRWDAFVLVLHKVEKAEAADDELG